MSKTTAPSPRRSRAIDPQMRCIRWSGKNHTREARLFRSLRTELVVHIGGKPSATQRALIDRAAMIQTHLARMDQRIFEEGELSDHASRCYIAFANASRRILVELGLQPARAPAPSVLAYLGAAK